MPHSSRTESNGSPDDFTPPSRNADTLAIGVIIVPIVATLLFVAWMLYRWFSGAFHS